MSRKQLPLLSIFLAGLTIRLILIFYDFSWDVNNHIGWAKDLWAQERGFSGFYEIITRDWYATKYPNYPPVAMYIFYLTYPLQELINNVAWFLNTHIPLFPSKLMFFIQSRIFLAATFKLPAIIADFGIAWLCYRITGKKLAAALTLFNPAFFYNSALWGQIDSIPLFFVLLSIFIFLYHNNTVYSVILFTISLLIKPTTLVFAPLYFVMLFRHGRPKDLLKLTSVSLVLFYLSFLPFYKTGNVLAFPFEIYKTKILEAQSLSYVTNGAFNFWLILTQFKGILATTPFLFGLSYTLTGLLISTRFYIGIITEYLKKKGNSGLFYYSMFLCAFAAFLFLTKMHERYSMLPLPFLLLASTKDKSLLKYFILLSLISFLNLYHSWAVPKIDTLFYVIDHPIGYTTISTINVAVFLYCLYRVPRTALSKEKV